MPSGMPHLIIDKYLELHMETQHEMTNSQRPMLLNWKYSILFSQPKSDPRLTLCLVGKRSDIHTKVEEKSGKKKTLLWNRRVNLLGSTYMWDTMFYIQFISTYLSHFNWITGLKTKTIRMLSTNLTSLPRLKLKGTWNSFGTSSFKITKNPNVSAISFYFFPFHSSILPSN